MSLDRANNPPVTEIDLSNDPETLRTTGRTVAIVLPDGRVIDLWIFHHPETTSVDVRYRASIDYVNGGKDAMLTPSHTLRFPNSVAVVLR